MKVSGIAIESEEWDGMGWDEQSRGEQRREEKRGEEKGMKELRKESYPMELNEKSIAIEFESEFEFEFELTFASPFSCSSTLLPTISNPTSH
jgi:hypothetical protein